MDTNQYFYRAAIYSAQGEKVSLVNIDNPQESSPLDSWLGIVVALADGTHTVQELLQYIASRYPGQAPTSLNATIESVLERLCEGEIIKMSDKKVELPYYLEQSIETMDIEKAKRLIQEDGYTQH